MRDRVPDGRRLEAAFFERHVVVEVGAAPEERRHSAYPIGLHRPSRSRLDRAGNVKRLAAARIRRVDQIGR